MRTIGCVLAAALLLVAGCGDDDDSGGAGSGWEQTVQENDAKPAPAFEGHKVWVDEASRTVYIEDCDAAERATTTGAPYGPSPRDPVTQESAREGYGSVCDSSTDR